MARVTSQIDTASASETGEGHVFGHRTAPPVEHAAKPRPKPGERMKVYPIDADIKALKPCPGSYFRR